MSTQTGLHYNRPCPCSEECLSFAAPPTRNISEEHWTQEETNRNRYCIPCRKAGCDKEGKHVESPDQPRQESV